MKAAEIRPLPPVRIQKKQKTLSTVLFAAGALILLLGVLSCRPLPASTAA